MATQIAAKEWAMHKIKDFGVVSTGTTPSTKKKEYYGGEYKLISPADLTDSKYIFTSHKLITEDGLRASRTLPKNAVLVGCIGNVGKIGMTVDEISAFNQQINAVVCNSNFNSEFVYYLLRYNKALLESKAAKVTLPILNKSNFENISFETPKLPEQKAISQTLTTVQNAIAEQEALIVKLKELKRSMMQYLFTHGTKGEKTKMTEIGEIPESWDVTELGDAITLKQYGLSKKGSSSGTYPVLRMTNQDDGLIDLSKLQFVELNSDELKKFEVHIDDIIFNRTNSLELVGRTSIYKHLQKSVVFASYLIRLKTDTNKLLPDFLNFYMNTEEIQRRLKGLATRGVSQSNISATRLATLEMPLPTLSEQEKIVSCIETADKKVKSAQEKLAAYQNLFKTLLHELMSGGRRVKT